MLSSRCLSIASRRAVVSRTTGISTIFPAATGRTLGTSVKEAATADDALRFSGYSAIDFTIPEDAPVYDAVQKFAAFNIGCLVTVDTAGKFVRTDALCGHCGAERYPAYMFLRRKVLTLPFEQTHSIYLFCLV